MKTKIVKAMLQKYQGEIAEAKMQDLNANDLDGAMKVIMGSARSMGIEVKD